MQDHPELMELMLPVCMPMVDKQAVSHTEQAVMLTLKADPVSTPFMLMGPVVQQQAMNGRFMELGRGIFHSMWELELFLVINYML